MTEKLRELLVLLEERLVEHDENRKEVQNKLLEVRTEITKDADSLEEKISGKSVKTSIQRKKKSSVSSKSLMKEKAIWMPL